MIMGTFEGALNNFLDLQSLSKPGYYGPKSPKIDYFRRKLSLRCNFAQDRL